MLRTHIVTLGSSTPEFPAECVSCGQSEPTSSISTSDRAFDGASLLIPLFYFSGRKVRRTAPCCRPCRWRDGLVKWGRVAVFLLVVWIGIQYAYPWAKTLEIPRALQKLLVFVVLAPVLALMLLWTYLFPRPFTLDVDKETVDYQFARRAYAEKFAHLNGGHVE